jgi:hypothetical protein
MEKRMVFILLGLVAITGLYCLGEAVCEKDWPRDTFGGFLTALGLLILWVVFV